MFKGKEKADLAVNKVVSKLKTYHSALFLETQKCGVHMRLSTLIAVDGLPSLTIFG